MRDCSQESYQSGLPDISKEDAIDFCLKRLFEDTKHSNNDEVVKGLIFEELIGTLLLVKAEIDINHYLYDVLLAPENLAATEI